MWQYSAGWCCGLQRPRRLQDPDLARCRVNVDPRRDGSGLQSRRPSQSPSRRPSSKASAHALRPPSSSRLRLGALRRPWASSSTSLVKCLIFAAGCREVAWTDTEGCNRLGPRQFAQARPLVPSERVFSAARASSCKSKHAPSICTRHLHEDTSSTINADNIITENGELHGGFPQATTMRSTRFQCSKADNDGDAEKK